ncbi:5-formyltetrahydrofolate cyclo-ligase [Coxiella endosymbiont of Ornithodoros maritimus]|uniref:5-formyltetrahydrofolate cyclo-ligase n=1 Tax=Coxiella endosymbiont of Ornithodoros maritimus TaxID=1656172 RepID=UPI002263B9B7|nr:5-formyltetrahydrofolate cyclo-ligase [Coxiella endosymbiont of Ornithodoros maritimus]
MCSMLSKKQLRYQLRQRRNGLSLQEKNEASEIISKKIVALPIFKSSERLAFYLSDDGEVDIRTAVSKALEVKKDCFLPILHCTLDHHLDFYSYCPQSELIKNRFGIEEPDPTRETPIATKELDLIFLPLVVFDKEGNRLGRGAGYYDRTLAFLKDSNAQKPKLIGVAYEFQKINSITAEKWDIPLNSVVTEKNIYHF